MNSSHFNILTARTLLYYEIFDHPLSARELFYLFPENSLSLEEFSRYIDRALRENHLRESSGFLQLSGNEADLGPERRRREALASRRKRIAKAMAFIIRRFPFVRGVFLSGDLSKGVAHDKSDIDFVVVTAPQRLWICRSALVLFKKIFLLNSKKYFCLNYYVAENDFSLRDRNYFTATEVAHLKPLFNVAAFIRYMNANGWIHMYFPNFKVFAFADNEPPRRKSLLQWFLELPFRGSWADRLDHKLLGMMKKVWQERYPEFDAGTRERLFRSTPTESCAYVGNFSDKVLALYERKLAAHQLR